jgi:hypothetical protein
MRKRRADIIGVLAAVAAMSGDEAFAAMRKPEKFAVNSNASIGAPKLRRKKVGNHFSYYAEKRG